MVSDPGIMKKFRVDRGAIKFVLAGANIMCPGLTSAGGALDDDVPADAPVVSTCPLFTFYNVFLRNYWVAMSCNELRHANHLINLSGRWSDQYTVSSFLITLISPIWEASGLWDLILLALSGNYGWRQGACACHWLHKNVCSRHVWLFNYDHFSLKFLVVTPDMWTFIDSCVALELGSMMSWMHQLKLLITPFAERVSTKELEWTTCTTLTMGFGRYNSAHMPCTLVCYNHSLASPVGEVKLITYNRKPLLFTILGSGCFELKEEPNLDGLHPIAIWNLKLWPLKVKYHWNPKC